MLSRMWQLTAIVLFGALIAEACAADDPIGAGFGSDVGGEPAGLIAFREEGCAACHGQNGEGGVGPAMGGHVAEQLVRQVRSPLGAMPLFTVAELSDEKLDEIIGFVEGLEPADLGDGHGGHGTDDTTTLDPREVLAGHHWMTLTAVQVGNVEGARHHIEDITDEVTGEHLTAMEEILELIDADDLVTVEQRLKEMVAGFVPEAGSIDSLHLRLALQALAVDDSAEAAGHLGRVGEGEFTDTASDALDALDAGEMDHATELLLDALGEAGHDEAADEDRHNEESEDEDHDEG